MKKLYQLKNVLLILFAAFLFSECIKNKCREVRHYTIATTVLNSVSEIISNLKSGTAKPIKAFGKMVIQGNYIYLNEPNEGFHVIDNTNPASPVRISFVPVPGNIDLAIKGNNLYADLYDDIITFDISDPRKITYTNIAYGIFQSRGNTLKASPDLRIVTAYNYHDTTVMADCNYAYNPNVVYQTTNSVNNSVGTTGSMSAFSIIGNYLYVLDHSYLNSLEITNPSAPHFLNKIQLSQNSETIYPLHDKLFIGTLAGMLIYSVTNSPENPVKLGVFGHIQICDPVIADDKYAYVTLHSGSRCSGFTNELQIVNLNDLFNPTLVKKYDLNNPKGLSLDGKTLFICDANAGLKVFDATDPNNLKSLKTFGGTDTYDVIANNGIAIVVATDGLYQYDYSNPGNIHLISVLKISK